MSRPTIRNALDFPDVHEVVGHGRARCSSSARSTQVEVEIILVPVFPSNGFRFTSKSPAKSVWVGCGELATLPVGSRWRLGELAGTRETDLVEGRGTVVSITPTVFGEWAGGKGWPPFFPTARLAQTRCFTLRLSEGNQVVMLPVTEAVRAVFGRTSDLLLQLYGGRVAHEVRRFQIAPELLLENADGIVRMRFLADP